MIRTNSELFAAAHQIAKQNRDQFASYREAFSAALNAAWKEARKGAQKDAGRATPYCKLWEKDVRKRLYINRSVALLRDLCDAEITYHKTGTYSSIEINGIQFSNRRGSAVIESVRRSYFDLVAREWHFDEDVPNHIREKIAA